MGSGDYAVGFVAFLANAGMNRLRKELHAVTFPLPRLGGDEPPISPSAAMIAEPPSEGEDAPTTVPEPL